MCFTRCDYLDNLPVMIITAFTFVKAHVFNRQLSGAMIRISNCEDRESGGGMDRTITMTGNAESVALAQYLINMRYDNCYHETSGG